MKRASFLAGILLLLPVIAGAQATVAPETKKDGFTLRAEAKRSSDRERGDFIACQVENTSSAGIRYIDRGTTYGFSFHLFDANGKEVPPLESWRKIHVFVPNPMGAGILGPRTLDPGKSLYFPLGLKDAYGDYWKSASRLQIVWEPMLLWPDDPPPRPDSFDAGLSVLMDVREIRQALEGGVPEEKGVVEEAPPYPTPPVVQNDSGESLASLQAILFQSKVVIGLVAGAFLLMILIRGARRRFNKSS